MMKKLIFILAIVISNLDAMELRLEEGTSSSPRVMLHNVQTTVHPAGNPESVDLLYQLCDIMIEMSENMKKLLEHVEVIDDSFLELENQIKKR